MLYWPALRSKRRFKAEDSSGFCLPLSITEWSAANKAVSQGLELGFCFQAVDLTSPFSGLQDRPAAKKSVGSALNCRLQACRLPVLTELDHARWQRIPLRIFFAQGELRHRRECKCISRRTPDSASGRLLRSRRGAGTVSLHCSNIPRHPDPLPPNSGEGAQGFARGGEGTIAFN